MPEPMSPLTRNILREAELVTLVEQYLPGILGAKVVREPVLGYGARPDFIATRSTGLDAIVEVKGVTPSTQTRLDQVVTKLKRYAVLYQEKFPDKPDPELVLVVPGALSPQHIDYLLRSGLATVIDGPALRAAGLDPESMNGLAEALETVPSRQRLRADSLLEQLGKVEPGRPAWSTYQNLCKDILEFSLCPPLGHPISELSNLTKVNRRDAIFPNYALAGFWEYMRINYAADYVVVDAKNYRGDTPKGAVLQVANYLSTYGTGLFGIISCRNGSDRSAEITRREQWAINRKMIVILNDDDLGQMIKNKISREDPSDVLRQKIEDFRLGF